MNAAPTVFDKYLVDIYHYVIPNLSPTVGQLKLRSLSLHDSDSAAWYLQSHQFVVVVSI